VNATNGSTTMQAISSETIAGRMAFPFASATAIVATRSGTQKGPLSD
jgi:hypothetical protein